MPISTSICLPNLASNRSDLRLASLGTGTRQNPNQSSPDLPRIFQSTSSRPSPSSEARFHARNARLECYSRHHLAPKRRKPGQKSQRGRRKVHVRYRRKVTLMEARSVLSAVGVGIQRQPDLIHEVLGATHPSDQEGWLFTSVRPLVWRRYCNAEQPSGPRIWL